MVCDCRNVVGELICVVDMMVQPTLAVLKSITPTPGNGFQRYQTYMSSRRVQLSCESLNDKLYVLGYYFNGLMFCEKYNSTTKSGLIWVVVTTGVKSIMTTSAGSHHASLIQRLLPSEDLGLANPILSRFMMQQTTLGHYAREYLLAAMELQVLLSAEKT